MNVERDIVDRTNVATASKFSPERRHALRINFAEISDFDQRHSLDLYSKFQNFEMISLSRRDHRHGRQRCQ